MKKVYLLAVMALLSFSVFAQNRAMLVKETAKISAQNEMVTGREVSNLEIPITPTILQTRSTDNSVGMTYYDLQSNRNVSQRIVAHEDGTVGFVWTTQRPGQMASRGSGYNYYDGDALVNSNSVIERIENERTGWPTMGALTEGGNIGEIVISHNSEHKLVVSTRATKGAGEWKTDSLLGPELQSGRRTSTALLWPAIATSGTTIHLIACTEQDTGFRYEGINTCLLYYKGEYDFETNEVTWEEPRIVGEVTSDYIEQFRGDSYAIAVNGDKVAVLVSSSYLDCFYWLSEDGGANWNERQLIYQSTLANFDEATTLLSEPHYVCDGSGTIAIGDDGVVHVAFGITGILNEVLGDGAIHYLIYIDAILYWNSEMDEIPWDLADEPRNNLSPAVLEGAGYQVFRMPTLDENNLADIRSGVVLPNSYGAVGAATSPQLLTDGNNVYIIYVAMLHYPIIENDRTDGEYYRGIFATKSTDNGTTWPDGTVEGVSWLSYGEGLFWVDWEFYTPETPPLLFTFSENVYPTVATNVVDGKINVMWQHSMLPGNEVGGDVVMAQQPSYMYWFSIDADSIGIYNNTREVYQGIWDPSLKVTENSITKAKIYPNPANNQVSLELTSTRTGSATITVTNIMGQTVMAQVENLHAGYNKFNFNVSHLSNGFYLVNVNTPTGKVTQKLIIQ